MGLFETGPPPRSDRAGAALSPPSRRLEPTRNSCLDHRMTNNTILILHGWSDSSESFDSLAEFLRNHGFKVDELYLGDYMSLEDDVTIADVSTRMSEVINERWAAKTLTKPFDMIVHSTGGLVARQWLCDYAGRPSAPPDDPSPVQRLIMLAPANFGSVLAKKGKSMLGRVLKGWNNWFETGREMLNSLELASPFQWNLVQRDLLQMAGDAGTARGIYGIGRTMPFVLTGSHPYPDGMRKLVNENGSDGTVRVPAANLNVYGVTIRFLNNTDEPLREFWTPRYDPAMRFPMAVLPDRTHASIVNPGKNDIQSTGGPDLGQLILNALQCQRDLNAYNQLADDWYQLSENTGALAESPRKTGALFPGGSPPAEHFHQYMQLVVRVTDDQGVDVDDYFLELYCNEADGGDGSLQQIHSEILEKVTVNSLNESLRCLYVDRTDLVNRIYRHFANPGEARLKLSISAAPPGSHAQYFARGEKTTQGEVNVHGGGAEPASRFLHRNSTHFVKIIIPRVPDMDVFKIRRPNPLQNHSPK